MILEVLGRNWWLVLLRGLLAVIFAICAFAWPGTMLVALILVFGLWAGIDGIFALFAAFGPNVQHRWVFILEGIVGIAAAIVAFRYPGLTGLTLVFLIAWWAIVTGVLEIIAAFQLRQKINDEWWLILAGAASILFGILLLRNPFAGALAVVWILGVYAAVFGIAMIVLSFRLRKVAAVHSPA
jgi:uncharacterized membrane protein HdeD (DUF308 family)